MVARSPKSVRHLLKDKPTLKLLELEISAQKALLERLRQVLPGDLAAHCAAARQRDQQLIVHADSPVWATRLRYFAPQLLSLLRPTHPMLREVTVKLLLTRSVRQPRHNSVHHSDAAAAIIHDSAQDTKQPQLRAALQRLSQALKRQQ